MKLKRIRNTRLDHNSIKTLSLFSSGDLLTLPALRDYNSAPIIDLPYGLPCALYVLMLGIRRSRDLLSLQAEVL